MTAEHERFPESVRDVIDAMRRLSHRSERMTRPESDALAKGSIRLRDNIGPVIHMANADPYFVLPTDNDPDSKRRGSGTRTPLDIVRQRWAWMPAWETGAGLLFRPQLGRHYYDRLTCRGGSP